MLKGWTAQPINSTVLSSLQIDTQPASAVRQGVSFIQDGSEAAEVVKPRTPGYPFAPLTFSLLLAA